jgi:uncharacterized integral membrane protein (TIGR00698 family)
MGATLQQRSATVRAVARIPAGPQGAAARVGPGLLVVAVLVAAAAGLSAVVPAVSPLLSVMALGAAIAPRVGRHEATAAGVRLAATRLLRGGVALVGLRVSASDLVSIGLPGLAVAGGTIAATLLVTLRLGGLLRVSRPLTLLIATGSGICGASAIAAMSSVVDAPDEDVAYSVATVTVLGTAAMVALPSLARLLGLSDAQAGLWIGGSIHEVAQVAAAGAAVSGSALAVAALVKMARVVLLAPVVAVAGAVGPRRTRRRIAPPGFVVAFLALVALRSVLDLPGGMLDAAGEASTLLLGAGLAALGLGLRPGPLRAAGGRPLVLGVAAAGTASATALALTMLLG